jgi:hypothetical protein
LSHTQCGHIRCFLFFYDLSPMQLKANLIGIITILLILTVAIGCSSHTHNVANRKSLSHLFNTASSVRIFSYVNRMYRTPVLEGEEPAPEKKDTVYFRVKNLPIVESSIKERFTLTIEQKDSLFSLLKTNTCKSDDVVVGCYDPAHAILFFDANNQPFEYIEICFSCSNYRTSGNFQLDFCYEKSEALKNLFHSFGIRYFGRY